ncbi:MAG: methionine--tRNA ligase [Candidatus Kapabacteria bacterium]|nr:methionine--tRNA ligase [Candidatus Kapabacteria bacterium]
MKRHLITSALPYANGYIHLGHVAGAYLPADLYVRFLRLCGERVLYICGSDEHGVAITIKAEQEGITPKENIDRYHTANLDAFIRLGMSYDMYGRTSDSSHHQIAQEWFTDFYNKGILVEKEEDQFYDEEANMFLPDRYVEGICPNCGSDKARGDQCDNCGAYYNQLDLKSPRSLVSGKPPVVRKTKHWYYPLGRFQEQLEQYISGHDSDWKDNVLQQSRSWLKQGLGDRAITRDLTWGVPVPLEEAKGKVLYVWFDAVLGYISATKSWAEQHGTPDAWKDWWLTENNTNETTEYIAFIGKDNIVFHTLMFPSMLMAKGGYVVPENVPANEFLNLEGQKFSKSRNWSIDLRDAVNDFPNHVDSLRYALAMNFPETRDSDFTWKDFQTRNNSELAGKFGNFINRSIQFLHKSFEGKVPTLPERFAKLPEAWKLLTDDFARNPNLTPEEATAKLAANHVRYFSEHDVLLVAAVYYGAQTVAKNYRAFRFRDAITETMNIAQAANKYFNDTAPWKSSKQDPDECAKTLYICVQTVDALATLFAPITPDTSRRIQEMLGTTVNTGTALQGERGTNVWDAVCMPHIPQGTAITVPEILFTKIEDDMIDAQTQKLGGGTEPTIVQEEAPVSDIITIDDFMKVKLRTAKVLEAERVPKSEKLLKLKVETEGGERQIFAGIAKYYAPEDMIGKMVVIVWNLAPRKMMGSESQGMVLAVNAPDGTLSLITPDKPDMPSGGEVR